MNVHYTMHLVFIFSYNLVVDELLGILIHQRRVLLDHLVHARLHGVSHNNIIISRLMRAVLPKLIKHTSYVYREMYPSSDDT